MNADVGGQHRNFVSIQHAANGALDFTKKKSYFLYLSYLKLRCLQQSFNIDMQPSNMLGSRLTMKWRIRVLRCSFAKFVHVWLYSISKGKDKCQRLEDRWQVSKTRYIQRSIKIARINYPRHMWRYTACLPFLYMLYFFLSIYTMALICL